MEWSSKPLSVQVQASTVSPANICASSDLNTVLVVLGGGQPADDHVAVVDTVHLGNSESREQLGDETLSGLASIGLV